ncbi:uncharacterized protein TNCV_413101 [Trichonephila clavipes]|nr:uncharacterized protein TNCV_413101 [Trichonephila clavipes]
MPSIGGYPPNGLASILTGLESNRACVGYAWPTNCNPSTPPTCLPDLRRALLDEWCNIPEDQIDNLILSMPRHKGAWAYHTIQENHSFRFNDCASKLIQTCFDPKFTCARTKSEAIVVYVLTPTAVEELKYDLDKCNCITILNDASNHGNKKIYLIVARFFQHYVGVQVKILDFQDQPGETSDIIVNHLNQVLTDNNLTAKVVAFCGDNANVNFGGAVRRGTNNVLTKLQSSLKKDLIGIGCGAHVIHNAIKSTADELPVDYESVIMKIYSFFYIYTIQVEALKEFCAETETEYQQMLDCSKTR